MKSRNGINTVLKNIVKLDLESDKIKKWITILTISIATSIILIYILIMSNYMSNELDMYDGESQVIMRNMSEEYIDKLKKQPEVGRVGEQAILGSSKQNGILLTIVYQDKVMFENQNQVFIKEGKFPEEENEIMLSKKFLKHVNSNVTTGESIAIDLTGEGIKKEYIISGIIEGDLDENSEYQYKVYTSKSCSKSVLGNKKLEPDIYVLLKLNRDSESEAIKLASSIGEKIGISSADIIINPQYRFGGVWSNYIDTIKSVAPIVILLLIMAGTVIYSIFSISISRRIRIYGQLRTLGMTKRQLRLLVRAEGFNLAKKGVLIGILIGNLISLILYPSAFKLSNSLIWSLLTSIFIFIVVFISIKIPSRKVSKISPLEGSKYQPYNGSKKMKHKLKRILKPSTLAFINLGRNPIKTIATIASLSMCGILLVIIASFGNSYDATKAQRFYFYPNGDIQVSISSLGSSSFVDDDIWREGVVQSKNNPITDSLYNKIKSIEGVNKITPALSMYLNIESPSGSQGVGMQPVISKKQFEQIKPAIVSGDADFKDLINKNGILISDSEIYKAKVGEFYNVTMINKDGNIINHKMEVLGVFSQDKVLELSPIIPRPDFVISTETAKNLSGIENMKSCFEISVDEGKEEHVESVLRNVVNKNTDLELNSLYQIARQDQEDSMKQIKMISLFPIILFIFSVINLTNMIVANMNSRKRELGLYQAEGMTSNQIFNMLQIESLYYTTATALSTLTIGSFLGYKFCKYIDSIGHCISYKYPIFITGLFIILLLAIQVCISLYVSKNLKNESIVSRMSIND